MNRRDFIKMLGILGSSVLASPAIFDEKSFADLLSNKNDFIKFIQDEIGYARPATMPKIIHIFLYGGASELAGNLTNIHEINKYSQNRYPGRLLKEVGSRNGEITKNALWKSAGGENMERLLASGDMSLYRTVYRIKQDLKTHKKTIHQNLVGNLDVDRPGIAATLAAILAIFKPYRKEISEMKLPFVTFEKDSLVFSKGSVGLPDIILPIPLTPDFSNPFARDKRHPLPNSLRKDLNDSLDKLANKINERFNKKFPVLNRNFVEGRKLDEYISSVFNKKVVEENLPIDPETNKKIKYPNTTTGNMLKAAVSLAILNPDTVFINIGSAGTGLWDDHSDGIKDYPVRMRQLMEAIEVAVKHMKLAGRNDIIINVFGDFGRNVNLNNTKGWDHGNNQNLYTFGGSGIDGRQLGKIVGKTKRIGTKYQNRQFTAPTDDSYHFEPFAIASTIYKYFGVQNPEILTDELPIDENAPNELTI